VLEKELDKMLSRFTAISALSVAAFSSALANETYKIDPAHSTIGFTVHQYLGVTTGKFSQFSGTIDIDREHPERSAVAARIAVSSIDTRIRKRDDHLRSPEFFSVAKFPEITFKSRSVKQTGTQSGDILGDLTMHGVTKPITLHVKLLTPLKDEGVPKRSHWEVTSDPLKRRDFGLMFSGSAEAISGISQDVAVRIEIEAIGAG
jgi:polyisoprenoid-binding protein YceI